MLKIRAIAFVKNWLRIKSSEVKHAAVARSIYQEMELTTGYLLVLTIANLIALTGLLTDNTAIIIGAMLISPLMGPILSTGFAFITGNEAIGRKALTTVAVSVGATIVVAALATMISPLDSATGEILARTRPNLYDLIVAFLAGTVGAIALCTKRNYLTIVPGVAIATAVIPPLSVAGYGLGSFQPMIALGGFFLFFTNFVAIIIATCIVFLIYGFRPSAVAGTELAQLKHRFIVLGAILFVISLPLLYTLHASISEVRLRGAIGHSLKRSFDKDRASHLTRFEFRRDDGKVRVKAAIQTTSYLGEADLMQAEKDLSEALRKKVSLDVEQVLMQAGALKQTAATTAIAVKPSGAGALAGIDAAINPVDKAASAVDRIIRPYRVYSLYLGKKDGSPAVHGIITIRKDNPLTQDERGWLEMIVSDAVGAKVELTAETVPLLDPLMITGKESYATEEVKKALSTVGEIYGRQPSVRVVIEAGQYLGDKSSARKRLARERAAAIREALITGHGIPKESIRTTVAPRPSDKPTVTIRVTGT